MAATTTIRELIEGIEAQIAAIPDLGVFLFDGLAAPETMPQHRGALGVSVRRELTRNLNETRNQDVSRVEDLVVVTIQRRVAPKDQKTARGEAYDLEDAILNRVTSLAFERRWNATHLDTRENLAPSGEWFRIFLRFSLKRFEPVGAG